MRIRLYADPASIHTKRWVDYFQRRHTIASELPTPDLLHALSVTQYGWEAASNTSAPLVITAMGEDLLLDIEKPQAAHRTKEALERATLVTADSLELCEVARRLGAARVELVRFGADLRLFSMQGEPERFRRSLQIPLDAPLVFSPRACTPIYKIDLIADAISLLAPRYAHATFVFNTYRCDPQYKAEIEKRLPSGIRICFAGPFDGVWMRDAYLAADCVVSVASKDGFPVTIFEALGCGRPLVLSRLSPYQELIEDGLHALMVDPSPEALAGAIQRVLEEPALASRLGAEGRKVALAYGDYEKEMEQMEKLLNSVLQALR